ncbi:H+/gluconate symporter [Kytococcus aerolatus]|uniref:H+/gluconate symporter n=1 Tax=Kytococcus aerolatus TaxID=592308 RepID=A0A212TCI1_9MICO|nr:GntP family permease [Kytococcus aerolatus]SNC63524.1 H+/gluconate symporter [Kytococcus aerolatus]
MSLGLIGIFLSLAFLIGMAYRGHSVLLLGPLAALIATILSGAPLLASYTQVFMPAAAKFISSFFPLFLAGAIFGQLMTASGMATRIAGLAARVLGARFAVLVTVVATALLTYGGVNGWVVVFTIFPIAMSLFKVADVPRRLMPGAIAFGIFTFAAAALPGSPQIHNAIPAPFFGTDTFAAPGLSLIGTAIVLGVGMLWLAHRERTLRAAGEHFDTPTHNERTGKVDPADLSVVWKSKQTDHDDILRTTTGQGLLALVPILAVVATNALMTYVVVPRMDAGYLAEEKFGGVDLKSVAALWSVTVALVVGCLIVMALNARHVGRLFTEMSEGARNAVLPIFNTASEVGFGATIASLAAFAGIRDGIMGVSDNAVVTSAVSSATISGVTGSGSGGMTIALEAFGEQLATMAQQQGIDMELMHRATAMAAVSWDSLPHNGAMVTLLLVTGLTHRESYKDMFVLTVLIPFIGVATVIALGLAVGSF